jgi:hypothetical protein
MLRGLAAAAHAAGGESGQDRAGQEHVPLRPVSFATGLPWHLASRKRDRQLLLAAKKGQVHAQRPGRTASGAHGAGGLAGHALGHDHEQTSLEGAEQRPSSREGGPHEDSHQRFMHLGRTWGAGADAEMSVDEALRRGADINVADYNGNTALHYACEEGYQELVEYLLSCHDVSIDVASLMDWTPLHCAASKGRIEAIRALVQKGCDINLTARDGNTALHFAAMGGHLAAVELLVEAGCNSVSRNHEGRTAADLAALFQNGESENIIQHLLHYQIESPTSTRAASGHFALEIRLLRGKQVVSLDVVGNSDPYCAFCLSNPPGFVRSRTCDDTSEPEWNQTLLLRINLAPQLLRVEIWDDDFGESDDDFIGKGAINLNELVSNTKTHLSSGEYDPEDRAYPQSQVELEIMSKRKLMGIITIGLKILRIPDHLVRRHARGDDQD